MTDEDKEEIITEILARVEKIYPVHKRNTADSEKDNFLRYLFLAISANLYNGSPGRDAKSTAKVAYNSSLAHWQEWMSHV